MEKSITYLVTGGNELKNEITHLVERFELLEKKFGIAISGLYATCKPEFAICDDKPDEPQPPRYRIQINFDVTRLSEVQLEKLAVNAAAYDSADQLLGEDISICGHQCFSSESMQFFLDQKPGKIRLYPSVWKKGRTTKTWRDVTQQSLIDW